ncbi:hypothetical protein [Caulobacter henricii]|uniref:Uncharacterized protein n=1 Tax=Caulobacter henricii TaxID=69395 RepID=A0A0N7JH35_9CAUL|nr:hypothetical protein [Caulobacter henricii]ALL12290.1 hypothetical protein AQ619_02325 [Caulobacter henricii]
MSRFLLIAAAGLALGACAATPPVEAAARCDVTVKFGSYGMGIDRPLADRIDATVKADGDIARSERRPWGREGEYDLCLQARAGRDARALYARYRALLPGRALNAPTSIEGPDGLRYETIAPM